MGGLTGELTRWADKAFGELGDELQPVAQRVLTDLVTTEDENHKSLGRPRKRPLPELLQTDDDGETVLHVVQRLTKARLLITSGERENDQQSVELIHGDLLRKWGRFRGWLRKTDRRVLPGRPDEVAGRAQGRLERDSENPQRIQSTQGFVSEASEHEARIIAFPPQQAQPTAKRGEVESKRGSRANTQARSEQPEERLEDFDRIISQGFLDKGLAMGNLGRYEDAVEALSRALSMSLDDPVKGLALFNLRHYEEALDALNHTLSSVPDDPVTWYTKGLTLVALGRYEEAFAAFKEAQLRRRNYLQVWSEQRVTPGDLENKEDLG
jgi:tetratricopeptide (TPR) repeat protein